MPFHAPWVRRLWMSSLATLTVIACVGVAMAEPPRHESPSAVPVIPVDDELWRTTADEVGEYIRQLERHLEWMHRRAELRKDSDTLAEIEAIRKKLAVAKEHHRELCRLCGEQLHDTTIARSCCQKIDEVMHEVIEDHLALMRRLTARRNGHPRNSR